MLPSLYIHIPFCAKKCSYCDFASYPNRESDWDGYFKALQSELGSWIKINGRSFRTAFIGGGTPSVVNREYICRLAEMIDTGEFTIEANPGTVDTDKLKAYRDSGINRISFGAQSFDDDTLARIGRIHKSSDIVSAVNMARASGFNNINIDLMYALPEQTIDMWSDTIDRAVSLNIEHISAYSLIIEENTPIAKWAKDMPEDMVNEMQRLCTKKLSDSGYTRYEISNYAKSGYECNHNKVYWLRGDYIGIGVSAHSLYGNERFSNPVSLDAYLRGVRKIDVQELTKADEIEETVLLGTRMTRGILLSDIPNKKPVDGLVRAGFAKIDGDRFALTERGMELQNAIVLELIEQ